MTPAQRARAAALARADVTAPAGATGPAGPSGLARMLVTLKGHMDQLRAIKSMAARAEAKRDLIPGYRPYVDEVLAADTGRQDPVVVMMMIWSLDVGDWPAVLRLAAYVIGHGLAMPDGFDRDAVTWLVEELARAAEIDPAALPALDSAMRLTEGQDMHDQVRAKALKVLGLAVEDTDPGLALDRLEHAYRLDRGAGVKKALDRVRKRLAAPDDAPADAHTDTGTES